MPNDIEMSPTTSRPKKGGPPEETDYKPVNWRRIFLTPKYIPIHFVAILLIIFTVFITIKHTEVVEKLRPFSEKLRELPAGWLIPIVILFIISFPPLFGHEIVGVLCGVVWGLWIGFAILAAGTFLGEIGTWYAFKYTLRRRAEKLERTNLNYGALARLTRDTGFWVVLLIRLSAVPTHFSTAVFSTCNVKFWHFFVATFLSLPKQIFLVYVGVLLVQQKDSNVIQNVVFAAVFVVSVAMGGWVWWRMKAIKALLLEEQADRRAKKLRAEMESLDKERSRGVVRKPVPAAAVVLGGDATNPTSTTDIPPPPPFRERSNSVWDTHRETEPVRQGWQSTQQQQQQSRPPPQGSPFGASF
ncbi:hypothetical protein DM02DRAFT_616540 [Periconia macrospinosa]|uniref:Golgi apparatus membrane protein TVP38 n=1 Tax=Periconia macrospinosa TaxID=97972 RepID=A0A2V1DJE1_9PLEO|nr:hypothetical protein DM02DRAFT_616540 [Periconia macrospinosa]